MNSHELRSKRCGSKWTPLPTTAGTLYIIKTTPATLGLRPNLHTLQKHRKTQILGYSSTYRHVCQTTPATNVSETTLHGLKSKYCFFLVFTHNT